MTGYDVEILQKYELEQAIYVYVGSSCAYNMKLEVVNGDTI
ncbi:hypothetical protein RHK18_21180 [Clostridioides difficile]|nr:hypothetical protein [Clostridioides difficile]